MGQMNEVFIVGIIFFSFYGVIKVLSDNRLRHKLIDKGQLDENVHHLYDSSQNPKLASLKWGFVLVGVGLALLIGQLLPAYVDDSVIVGGMFIMAGAGLLLFYAVSNRLLKKSDQE